MRGAVKLGARADAAPCAAGRCGVAAALALLAAVAWTGAVGAQVDPSARWETLRTAHFRVHFNPDLEEQARRAAANAERAYTLLSAELVPPRQPIDIVLADNVDYSNGQTTPFPTNRVIVYAYPPVDASGLRYYGDWNMLLIQHELTHVFHLDRARGWWRVAQHVFGRNPVVMPNLYMPAWITEGLAVYYESKLTGFGRLNSSAHRTIAEAAAMDSSVPRLDQLSLIAPQWPNGNGPYVYGSLLFNYLADSRGPATVPAFVEASSGEMIPYLLDHVSHQVFGISFEDAWRHWRDSVTHAAATTPDSHVLALRSLSKEGYDAEHPRWVDSTHVMYGTDTERDVPGVYVVAVTGGEDEERLGRRNDVNYNVPTPGGVVYSQLEYTSPYDVRMDLYRSSGNGSHETRLTHGARLANPDVRPADGRIVAVWVHGGSSQLVLATSDGRRRTPITSLAIDTEWSQPHWSPEGARIAAIRWERGGYMDVVVLDTAGRILQAMPLERAVVTTPTWTPDGRHLLFTSDRTGRPDLYQASLGGAAGPVVTLVGGYGAGIADPAVSPDGHRVAVVELRGDGDHVAVAPYDTALTFPIGDVPTAADSIVVPPVTRDSSPARPYSPWNGLIPRYWMPVADYSDQGNFQLGAYTSSNDVLQEHSYAVQALYDFRQPTQVEWTGAYEYRGLGLPVIDLGAEEFWTHDPIANADGQLLGLLVHRTIMPSIAATLLRPRFRTNLTWTVGADWEFRTYATTPAALLGDIDPFYASSPNFPSVFTTVAWTNARSPDLAISPEDGIALSGTGRIRWQDAAETTTERSVVGVFDAYKSIPLPGFAHHVIAAQAAVGLENADAISTFTAGGRSGQSLQVVPGITVGDEPQDFGVRGYPLGSAQGTRAFAGSLEYRMPLFEAGRGWHLLPVFLGTTSLSVFTDAAEAWCPSATGVLASVCDAPDAQRKLMNSVGAELNFVTSLQYDVPYRLRLGMGAPLANRRYYGAGPVDFYITFGLPY
jgi:WD40-like Beta Propeller Repeat